MTKIKVLDEKLINLIAAGEVVERPSSIIKELVENSLDANSTEVIIEIKNGGIDFIKITDNGVGMSEEDAIIAWQRHATSKIGSVGDLFKIATLGFRGEALASIAAVSQVELLTKEKMALHGTRILIAGGRIEKVEPVGCPEGTTLIINNIFYNTPARRKFLKSPTTESGQIGDLVTKLAVANPHISLKYINNNQVYLDTTGASSLKNIIALIYGKDITNNLLELNGTFDNISVKGFISNPNYLRGQKNHITWVVNGRYIQSDYLTNLLLEGYHTLLPKGKFPLAVIHLNIDPSNVDINIHPAKLDIRFENPDILRKLKEIIRDVLQGTEEAVFNIPLPKMDIEETSYQQIGLEANKKVIEEKRPITSPIPMEKAAVTNITNTNPVKNTYVPEERTQYALIEEVIMESNNQFSLRPNINKLAEKKDWQNQDFQIIGQFANTFILIEMAGDLFIIDQHTAHERILYEKYMESVHQGSIAAQELLIPETIQLSGAEEDLVIENILLFKELGIILEHFGPNTFLIRALPMDIKDDPKVFLMELLDQLKVKARIINVATLREKVLTLASCKAAIKANQRITFGDMEFLIDRWKKTQNPHTCPHGRPIAYKLSLNELHKFFKRI